MQTFPELYPNTWKCLVQTLRKDGVFRGLYAGNVWKHLERFYQNILVQPANFLILFPISNARNIPGSDSECG